jgi:hypothetical protein
MARTASDSTYITKVRDLFSSVSKEFYYNDWLSMTNLSLIYRGSEATALDVWYVSALDVLTKDDERLKVFRQHNKEYVIVLSKKLGYRASTCISKNIYEGLLVERASLEEVLRSQNTIQYQLLLADCLYTRDLDLDMLIFDMTNHKLYEAYESSFNSLVDEHPSIEQYSTIKDKRLIIPIKPAMPITSNMSNTSTNARTIQASRQSDDQPQQKRQKIN